MNWVTQRHAALACATIAWALSGAAFADGGRITFSGALVNPSCQLSPVVASGAPGATRGTVVATQCGDNPATFSSTLQFSSSKVVIGTGIAHISIRESTAGPTLEVSYN